MNPKLLNKYRQTVKYVIDYKFLMEHAGYNECMFAQTSDQPIVFIASTIHVDLS